MQSDRQQIIDYLTGKADQEKVDQPQSNPPEQIDTENHYRPWSKLGYSPKELWDQLGGRGN